MSQENILKQEKGITLIVLAITVAIMLIILVTISINIAGYSEKRNFTNLETDLKIVKEKVDMYYGKNRSLPTANKYVKNKMQEIKLLDYTSVNDNENYYVVDLSLLDIEDSDLTFGKDFNKISDKSVDINEYEDIFVVNEDSHTIYYPKGVYMDGKFYYTFNDDDEAIEYSDLDVRITNMRLSDEHLFSIKSTVKILGGRRGMDKTACRYVFTDSSNEIGTESSLYTDGILNQTLNKIEIAKGAGNWYLHVLAVDKEGNKIEQVSDNYVTVGEYADFDYTGNEQTANLLPGTYKLETWGAAGGYAYDIDRKTGDGGYGGYSTGNITFENKTTVYINVGGEGESNKQTENAKGGYNGGSDSTKWANKDGTGLYTGGGGGATHIAKKTGLLKDLESDIDEILIVSGAGGGGDYYPLWNNCSTGGSGGGISGNNAVTSESNGRRENTAGMQSSGYAFGTAGTTFTSDSTGGSGGGFYGGKSENIHATGAGGSGYIGNDLLTDKHMAGYNVETSDAEKTKTISVNVASESPAADTAKKGNGYARITNLNKDNVANIETEVSITMKNSRKYLFSVESEIAITGGLQGETRYIYTNSDEALGTDPSLYVEGSFTGSSTTIEKAKGPGTYYLHVLVTDSNGIRKEFVSNYSVTIASTADFFYSGTEQTTTLAPGTYKFECWGAQGGGNTTGGYGAYTSGIMNLAQNSKFYVYVGNKPDRTENSFNGGGQTNNTHYPTDDGGGATDIRLVNGNWDNFNSLKSRIMVAGAGGGAVYYNSTYYAGASAGGLNGFDGIYAGESDNTYTTGATQISGGLGDNTAYPGENGSFGKGGNGDLAYGGGRRWFRILWWPEEAVIFIIFTLEEEVHHL